MRACILLLMQRIDVGRFGVMRQFEFDEIGVAEDVETVAARRRTQLAWSGGKHTTACYAYG